MSEDMQILVRFVFCVDMFTRYTPCPRKDSELQKCSTCQRWDSPGLPWTLRKFDVLSGLAASTAGHMKPGVDRSSVAEALTRSHKRACFKEGSARGETRRRFICNTGVCIPYRTECCD